MTATLFNQPKSIAERFAEFDAQHPEIFEMFRRFAWELVRAGHRHGSAEQIVQRIRWETSLNPERDGGWKLNNWFRALYARKLAAEEETFRTFFRFRACKAMVAA